LKCRQRKKQWLHNLQAKVELYSQENDALTHTVNQLREHVMGLRNILQQHKDCPVTLQQGLNPQTFMAYMNSDTMSYMPVNGVAQSMGVMMADGRQGPGNAAQVIPRS
jgi:ATF/CREB family transcription factor